MSDFNEYHALDGSRRPIEGRVRLDGDGWYIEVWPSKDGHGLEISTGSHPLVILPRVSNVILVCSDFGREQTIDAEARRLVEIEKQNESSSPKKKR